jgi:CBS-domain-containing membrane protein
VKKDVSTLSAFQTFFTKGVNAVPIVDENGELVGNLSPNDLKVMPDSSIYLISTGTLRKSF